MNECQWQCPDCGERNHRDHEGLDVCVQCGTEVATYYHPGLQDRLVVKWWRSTRIASESQRPPLAPRTCSASGDHPQPECSRKRELQRNRELNVIVGPAKRTPEEIRKAYQEADEIIAAPENSDPTRTPTLEWLE